MDALSQLLSLGCSRVELEMRCLLDGTFTIAYDAPPPSEVAFHLMLSGQCRLRVAGGRTQQLGEGDLLLLPGGGAYEILDAIGARGAVTVPVRELAATNVTVLPVQSNIGDVDSANVDMLCGRLVFGRGAGDLMLRALPRVMHIGLCESSGLEPLQMLMGLLRSEMSREQPGARAIVDALGQALLTYALRAYGQDTQMLSGWLAVAVDARLGPSIRAMLQAPAHPWTVASLGNVAAMSRATYARHFREKAGMSVGAFVAQIRMMHACALLRDSGSGQAAIGEAVGYRSEAAFGKAFRDVLGMTPGRWRRTHRCV
ncbi:AraC family transcriptional regulator [Burkholderia sp. BCC1644]|uniref:AraC family transcriptional regulator n=1 Tax=Burkholderia sp. BCC1644 TaxID=2676293 RepID=UPI0015904DA4|nr:AraC family transcriptional regulator [Burkholderia sp. BCC1644]